MVTLREVMELLATAESDGVDREEGDVEHHRALGRVTGPGVVLELTGENDDVGVVVLRDPVAELLLGDGRIGDRVEDVDVGVDRVTVDRGRARAPLPGAAR